MKEANDLFNNKKYKILFVCLGNICRSPMAEYVMKDLTSKAGLSEQFEIASAATSAWEIGNPVYPPARQCSCYPPGISVGFYFPSGPNTRFL
mgnify:CR=1 FL=1